MTAHAGRAIVALGLAAGTCLAQSRWQGRTWPAATHPTQHAARFLALDTGGSGGGFGQGDIRQKLHGVCFWDERIGWTCGYGGVFRTADGGLTWTRMKRRGGWYHIEITGPDDVWLLEGFHGQGKAKLWHTADSGATWSEVMAGKLRGYADLYCRGRERWVLCGGYPSYRSSDGGRTWRREHFGGLLHQANRIAISADRPTRDGFVIYVLGAHKLQRRLIKSTDAGRTWQSLPLPQGTRHHRCRLFFATSRHGWVGGPDGLVLHTTDGGQTWERRDVPARQWVMDLWIDRFGRGFAAVDNSDYKRFKQTLYETRNAGRTWTPVLGGAKHVSAICALGPGRLWAVGDVPGYVPNDLVAILAGR